MKKLSTSKKYNPAKSRHAGPGVSVVLVSHNTADLTKKSINSIIKSSNYSKELIEIILVDNNSTDQTVSVIKKLFPEVKVVVNQKNLGFGAGNNVGVNVSHGEYVLLLNTDAFLSPDTLPTLISRLSADSSLLAVSPILVYEDSGIQQSVGYFPTPTRVTAWMWGLDKIPVIKTLFPEPYHFFDTKLYNRNLSADWLMGAVVLLRRNEYLSVGGFDEDYFMYGEEVELFYRLRLKYPTKKSSLISSVQAIHLGSASTKKTSAHRLTQELRGIEYFYHKHLPHLYWYIKLVITIGVLIRLLIFSFIPARRETLVEYRNYFS